MLSYKKIYQSPFTKVFEERVRGRDFFQKVPPPKNISIKEVKKMDETANVKALDKALVVLELMLESEIPLGVNDIAAMTAQSPATVFRTLRTLKSRGWVYQHPDEKYSAGCRLTSPSNITAYRRLLREVAYSTMLRLSTIEREAMNLAVRDFDTCYILGQSRTEKIVDYVPPIGTKLPLHASACGKVLLSELDENVLFDLLDAISLTKMTDATITDRDKFIEVLHNVREQGYALDAHESQEMGFCIAVPIRSDSSEIVAALSFSGFIGRRTVDEIDRYVGLLHGAASEISEKMYAASKSAVNREGK